MDALDLSELGIWSVLIVLIFERVMTMLRGRGIDLGKLCRDVDSLVKLHAKTDTDGVPLVYVRAGLREAIVSLNTSIQMQTRLLERLLQRLEDERH